MITGSIVAMQSELRCMQVDAVTLEKSLREPWLKVPNIINRSLVTNVDSQPPLCASHLGVQNDMFNFAFVSRLRWGWWGGLLITCEGRSKERHVWWLWEANLFNVGAIGTEHGVSGLQGELSRSCDYLRSDLERCGRCFWVGCAEEACLNGGGYGHVGLGGCACHRRKWVPTLL